MSRFMESVKDVDLIFSVICWGMIIFSSLIIGLGICNLTQSKEFNGYYMDHFSNGAYTVQINWGNRPDTTAFKSYDEDAVIKVYKQLSNK